MHIRHAVRESLPKSGVPEDRAGSRPFVKKQTADGSRLFVYHVGALVSRRWEEKLIVRLAVDGEVFVSIDRR